MTMAGSVIVVVAVPLVGLIALLLAAGRVQRARDERVLGQVAVTDAIHRELGAVVAPVVTYRLGRGWRVEIAVPFERPAVVGRIASVAHAALLRMDVRSAARSAIVLTAQAPDPHASVRRLHPATSLPSRELEVA